MGKSQLDGLVDEVQPVTQTVRITTRTDLVDQLRQLEHQLEDAQRTDMAQNKAPRAPKIAKHIEELEAEARASERELVLQSIGARAWSDLVAAHPPTKAQRDKMRGVEFNPETFPYAAVAASLGEPDDTGVRKLADKLSNGQWGKLWSACIAVNVGDVSVPFSVRASALLGRSEPSSESAESGESPDPTS